MIVLELEKRCHDCVHFEVETDDNRQVLNCKNFNGVTDKYMVGDLIIRCAHHEKCVAIERYVRESLKK